MKFILLCFFSIFNSEIIHIIILEIFIYVVLKDILQDVLGYHRQNLANKLT